MSSCHASYADPTFTSFRYVAPDPTLPHRFPLYWGSRVAQMHECDLRGLPGYSSCGTCSGRYGNAAQVCTPVNPCFPLYCGPQPHDLFIPGIPLLAAHTRSKYHLPSEEYAYEIPGRYPNK